VIEPGISDEATARVVASGLAATLLEPVTGVRSVQVRLGRLAPASDQARLFGRQAHRP